MVLKEMVRNSKTANVLVLFAAIIFSCSVLVRGQTCSSVEYPRVNTLVGSGFEGASTHLLIPQALFFDCGKITSCTIRATCSSGVQRSHNFEIQTWRTVGANQYRLRQTVTATLPQGCRSNTIRTVRNLNLTFQDGDILGLYLTTNLQPFVQIGYNTVNSQLHNDVTMYYTRASVNGSPSSASLMDYTSQMRAPLIEVVVDACTLCNNNSSNTNINNNTNIDNNNNNTNNHNTNNNNTNNNNNTTNDTGPSNIPDNSAVIAVGIIIPLLVVAGVAVAVIIVVFLYLRRRSSYDTPTDPGIGLPSSPYEVPRPSIVGPYEVPFITNPIEKEHPLEENLYAIAGRKLEDSNYWLPGTCEKEIYQQIASWKYTEIPRENIKVSKKIGQGQFGVVFKAELFSPKEVTEVAVKQVKSNAPEDERVKLLQEAAILGQFRHQYVAQLVGVVTTDQPVLMVMELLQGGSLLAYLRNTRSDKHKRLDPDLPKVLMQFCRQIACGLAYLATKLFVHRDIAARNILLDKNLNCKISDFGMTRELEDETYYFVKRKGAIPVKWTAPEAIYYKKYSTSSDIWSFGMLMFEIWSLGLCPFGELSHKMVVKMLQKPYCQSPPPGCPRAVYSIMVKCWATERSQRPTADDLSRIYFAADNQALLAWSDEDRSTGPESDVLGSPLERGSQLYLDLQHCYA